MTLFEALMDMGKGRFVDTGCDWMLVALAKGTYTFRLYDEDEIIIVLNGTPSENAHRIEKEWYDKLGWRGNRIIKADYSKTIKQ